MDKLDDAAFLQRKVHEGLNWLGGEVLRQETRVFLKPNLTWRKHLPGVTTSPAFIEAVVAALKERTDQIIIGESDGGYHSFLAEDAFQSHGLYELARKYGIGVVNLSRLPSESATVTVAGRAVTVELPSLLLHDVDVFVTLPVPKVHVMTRVSLGFKNQWGCQPGTMRLFNHPEFSRKVLAINKLLNPKVVIVDGVHFLDETGPMIGKPIRMDLVIISDNVGAADLTCCEIMGVAARNVPHLRFAQRQGMMPREFNEVSLNRSIESFKTHRFKLQRHLIHYIALGAFHSRVGTQLFYSSFLAGPIHRALYAIRKNPLVSRILYGPVGPPPAEGPGRR